MDNNEETMESLPPVPECDFETPSLSPGHRLTVLDLPDEILEDIFSRLSPYNDLDNLKSVCKRWNSLAIKVIGNLKNNFEQSIITGRVDCHISRSSTNESGHIFPPGTWASERFGHLACYFDKNLYILGGATHTTSTFNDMWKMDLGTLTFSRCITSGNSPPAPKALASSTQWKDNLVVFGGWSHPSPYPLMQPWKIFDELHIYNFNSNAWRPIVSCNGPHPSAGHSASTLGDKMIVFGGRIFDQKEQSYPLSNSVWIFDFLREEWHEMQFVGEEPKEPKPSPRYGQTQISISDEHLLIIGGCGGPNQIYSDVWLLTIGKESQGRKPWTGKWERIQTTNLDNFTPNDFHYDGCKIGDSIVFFERSSPISPFLAFLHFDAQHNLPPEQHGLVFEPSSRYFHSNCSSGLRNSHSTSTMSLYTLNISKVLTDKVASWFRESNPLQLRRPSERLLYSMVQGRAELIIFGGFYKDPNSPRCRVSNDLFIMKPLHKSY